MQIVVLTQYTLIWIIKKVDSMYPEILSHALMMRLKRDMSWLAHFQKEMLTQLLSLLLKLLIKIQIM